MRVDLRGSETVAGVSVTHRAMGSSAHLMTLTFTRTPELFHCVSGSTRLFCVEVVVLVKHSCICPRLVGMHARLAWHGPGSSPKLKLSVV